MLLSKKIGIAVANALFQAEQDRINAEAAAALASSSVEPVQPVYGVPQTVAAPAPAPAPVGDCGDCGRTYTTKIIK